MRALIIIAAAALSLSCSHPAPLPGSGLAQETAGRVAGPPRTCISSYPSENLRILDPQTVAYGFGGTIYINHLPAACPVLSQFNTTIVEADDGQQYCRGNRIRGLEPGGIIAGPICNLGDWIPYKRQ